MAKATDPGGGDWFPKSEWLLAFPGLEGKVGPKGSIRCLSPTHCWFAATYTVLPASLSFAPAAYVGSACGSLPRITRTLLLRIHVLPPRRFMRRRTCVYERRCTHLLTRRVALKRKQTSHNHMFFPHKFACQELSLEGTLTPPRGC